MQQNVLDPNPSAKIRVYAIWYAVLPGDSREAWTRNDSGVITDSRVVNGWADKSIARQWVGAGVSAVNTMAYDAYYVYGPKARWDRVPGTPAPLVSTGSTIIARRDSLKSSLFAVTPRRQDPLRR